MTADRSTNSLTRSRRISALPKSAPPRAKPQPSRAARREAVAEWHQLIAQRAEPAVQVPVSKSRARQIIADFNSLVEKTAEDGFRERERALSTIHFYRWLVLGATLLVIVLGGGIAIVLSRRMIHPIAVASDAARRIAAGELDVEIAQAANDELGQLLRSMAVMRDNIRAMVEREIAARRSAQAALVSAIEGCEEGVVLLDADGCILTANSQLTRFFPEGPSFVAGEGLPIALLEAFTESRHELEVTGGRWLRLSRSATNEGGYVIIASDITSAQRSRSGVETGEGRRRDLLLHHGADVVAHHRHGAQQLAELVIGGLRDLGIELAGGNAPRRVGCDGDRLDHALRQHDRDPAAKRDHQQHRAQGQPAIELNRGPRRARARESRLQR